jgi:hypothetical protein
MFLVPDCVTDSIKSSIWTLRQQWTGSQLIPSEVTRAVPNKACFSRHPQIISVVQTWEAQEPPIAPKRVSRKPISLLGAYLTFFYKNNRPIFQTFQNRRDSQELPGFHRRTSGYLTFSNDVFVDNGLCISKTRCLVFSENRDDIQR